MRYTLFVLFLAAASNVSCASLPYEPAGECDTRHGFGRWPGEQQIERGRSHALLDGLGHYVFSLPAKLLLLSWDVEDHDISADTEHALAEYVGLNSLCHVKVRLNQYAPGGEWSRLFHNREVSGFWRFTLGFLSVTYYTAFPGRVFGSFLGGGDSYNPYTNTLSLYSDVEAIALHEGGHAKDFAGRTHKGFYAVVRFLPLAPLYQEGLATQDAVSYLRHEADGRGGRRAYPLLWGAYGSYVAGEGLRWYNGPLSYVIQLPFAWTGRFLGHLRAWTLDASPARAAAPDPRHVSDDPASDTGSVIVPAPNREGRGQDPFPPDCSAEPCDPVDSSSKGDLP